MVSRARFHGFYNEDVDKVMETVQITERDESAIRKLQSVNNEESDLDNSDIEKNIFGYIFAKGIEDYACTELHLVQPSEYSIHAFDGKLDTKAEGRLKQKLEYAMKYGKQFWKDFNNYTDEDDSYIPKMYESLKYVHALARACAPYYLSEDYELAQVINDTFIIEDSDCGVGIGIL